MVDLVVLNPEEKHIINALYVAHKPLTTKKVSEQSEMAWQTAKKYLTRLYEQNIVNRGKYGNAIYWWLKV